jgi:uncharacterized membrane protein
MDALKYLLAYVLTFVSFLIIDFIWLTAIAKDLYAKYLFPVIGQHVNLISAGIFYLIYIVGVFVLVIMPSIENGGPVKALVYGAIFGLVAYSTYDLTNLATIKDWPINITIIDLIWGTFVTATTSIIGFYITKAIIG